MNNLNYNEIVYLLNNPELNPLNYTQEDLLYGNYNPNYLTYCFSKCISHLVKTQTLLIEEQNEIKNGITMRDHQLQKDLSDIRTTATKDKKEIKQEIQDMGQQFALRLAEIDAREMARNEKTEEMEKAISSLLGRSSNPSNASEAVLNNPQHSSNNTGQLSGANAAVGGSNKAFDSNPFSIENQRKWRGNSYQ